VSAGTSHVF